LDEGKGAMLSNRLVAFIEEHVATITRRVHKRIHKEPRLKHITRLSQAQLLGRFRDVCLHLARWLTLKNDSLIESRYEQLGEERLREGIPLHEVLLVTQLFKRELIDFAREQAQDQTAYGVLAEAELEQLVGDFFDQVSFYVARGYERNLRMAMRRSA
jgi:hypothetical protein